MNPVVANALTTTATATVGEMAKLATSIVEHKTATYAINAERAKVETMAKLEHTRIQADAKQAKKRIKAQSEAFHGQLQSLNKDKKGLQKQLKWCTQQALNFSLTAEERQEAQIIAQMLMAQMDNIRHDQLTSYSDFNHRIGHTERHRSSGIVIDGSFRER